MLYCELLFVFSVVSRDVCCSVVVGLTGASSPVDLSFFHINFNEVHTGWNNAAAVFEDNLFSRTNSNGTYRVEL